MEKMKKLAIAIQMFNEEGIVDDTIKTEDSNAEGNGDTKIVDEPKTEAKTLTQEEIDDIIAKHFDVSDDEETVEAIDTEFSKVFGKLYTKDKGKNIETKDKNKTDSETPDEEDVEDDQVDAEEDDETAEKTV
jgi:ribosomal protein S24E